MRKQTPKQREKQVEAIIQNSVYGWQIPMMSICAISKAGKAAAGQDGPVDEQAVRDAVTAVLNQVAVRV